MLQPLFRSLSLAVLLTVAVMPKKAASEDSPDRADISVIAAWKQSLPTTPSELDKLDFTRLFRATRAVDEWAAKLAWEDAAKESEVRVEQIGQLIDAKKTVDLQFEEVLGWRGKMTNAAGSADRNVIRRYLVLTSQLIDLRGRLRYSLRDAIEQATYELSENPELLDQLILVVQDARVEIGAEVFSYVLEDPGPHSSVQPFPLATKRRVVQSIRDAGMPVLLPDLVAALEAPTTVTELKLDLIEAIRAVGLPQPLPPKSDPAESPPVITARGLHAILQQIKSNSLGPDDHARWKSLDQWLSDWSEGGVRDESYRFGKTDVQAGDWILMRNPSPYNRFTSHRPGLFTHVGIVTAQRGSDGVRRFVVVDLPERGDRVPATNVERFLGRTLHYAVLRHPTPGIAKKMGEVAQTIIGNESQFDLQFQTSRVESMRGKPLKGSLIHTYCAGLLLLAAQETDAPGTDFFPIREGPAEGRCVANLKKLGLAIGDNFVSPTSAIFSPTLEIVGRCEPMYEPEREIRESIFDYFANSMVERELVPAPNLSQTLRSQVAGMSRSNPWLARAMAKANRVHERTDLESAAKAAAVVETLDQIVERASNDFIDARLAITAEADERPSDPEEAKQFDRLRSRHASLVQRYRQEQLSPRVLRLELVAYYTREGMRQIDERFFASSRSTKSP